MEAVAEHELVFVEAHRNDSCNESKTDMLAGAAVSYMSFAITYFNFSHKKRTQPCAHQKQKASRLSIPSFVYRQDGHELSRRIWRM